ncbi:MAG: ABC transporter permease, partial [Chitinivibrionales bacterium]|nr:ABC transporter permease [Chitinivibrionales bacterium]
GGMSWHFLFPAMIILGFAFAFSGGGRPAYKVGVHPPEALEDSAAFPLLATRYLEFIPVDNLDDAISKVSRHQLDILVSRQSVVRYWINEESQKGHLAEKVLLGSYDGALTKEIVGGKQVRYVDWLVPGILAMNMMFSALFGVGWMIVRYRKVGYLKRLKATPTRAYEFLIGQILSRLVVIMGSSTVVFAGSWALIRFPVNGSVLLLALVFAVGTFCLISLGLVFAARFTNEELVGGLLNFLTWPMMFLSGVWFSLEGVNPMLRKAALAFPLTHIVNAARGIMIDGETIVDVIPELSILSILSIALLAVGSALFKWE